MKRLIILNITLITLELQLQVKTFKTFKTKSIILNMERMKRIMILGVTQILLGCFIGFIPPPAVIHFRSIVTAHIEFCVNGILLTVLGILTQYMDLNPFLFFILEITSYLGTYCNGAAFLVSAFTGFGTKLAPTINEKFPFPQGIEGGYSTLMTNILMICGVNMVISLFLALIGLYQYKPKKN